MNTLGTGVRTTQRQPAGVSIGCLIGCTDSGCLVSRAQDISLVLAWGRMNRGVIVGFQQPDETDRGGGVLSASCQCSAGKSVLSAPSGQPWVLRPPERNQAGERGQDSLAPWLPAFLTSRGQLQAR